MPPTAHDPQAFFLAIHARLVSATGKPIGLAEQSDLPAPPDEYPYAVLYPLPDESTDGSLSDPHQITVWSWQVTCVSDGPVGALSMQHRVREALLGHIPVVTGLGTTRIELAQGSGITRQDAPLPPLFYSTDRFIAYTST